MKEIGDREAAEAMFALLQANPWMLAKKPVTRNEPGIVNRAEAAITAFCTGETEDFSAQKPEVRDMATWLLMAFLQRLASGQYQHAVWSVPAGLPPPDVAKQVVLLEIARTTIGDGLLN